MHFSSLCLSSLFAGESVSVCFSRVSCNSSVKCRVIILIVCDARRCVEPATPQVDSGHKAVSFILWYRLSLHGALDEPHSCHRELLATDAAAEMSVPRFRRPQGEEGYRFSFPYVTFSLGSGSLSLPSFLNAQTLSQHINMQKRPRRNAKAEQATDHATPRVSGDLSGRLLGSPHRLRSDRAGLWEKKNRQSA